MITEHAARKGCLPHTHDDVYIYISILREMKRNNISSRQKREYLNLPNACSSASHNHLDEISFCERVFFSHCSVAVFSHAFRVVLQCLWPLWPENTRLIYFGFHFCSWTSEVTPPSLSLHVHGDSVKKSELGICQFQITDKGYWCWNMLKYQLVLRFNTTPITMHHDF